MSPKYIATASSSSRNPHDWGRAMAAALTELAQLADEGRGQQHEVLYGEDLRLKITPEGDGVQISLSWPIADTRTAE